MSGNGITGSLSSNISLAVLLNDLSLSNNILSGIIPSQIQERKWEQLDLSTNRFSGTLQSSSFPNLTSSAGLFLHDNRLSGSIPATIKNTLNISILTGNIFGCDFERSSLPIHYDDYLHYSCGSNESNYFQYSWICIVGFLCGAFLFFIYVVDQFFQKKEKVLTYVKTLWKQSKGSWDSSIECTVRKIIRSQLALLLVILVIGLPLYGSLHVYYSIH